MACQLNFVFEIQHLVTSISQVLYALNYCVLMAYVRGQYRQFSVP